MRVGAERCPFCRAEAAVEPGAVRPVGRRDLTRAAIFAGAALLAGCGGGDAEEPGGDDTTSGGDTGGGGDTGAGGGLGGGGDTNGGGDVQLRSECDEDPRRCRQLPQCVYDGTCPAPPYGAPPEDVIV